MDTTLVYTISLPPLCVYGVRDHMSQERGFFLALQLRKTQELSVEGEFIGA
jgi:hypothetical protein